MSHYQRKRRWKSILESWPVVGILGIILLFFALGVIGLLRKMEVTRDNKNMAQVRVEELELQKDQLTADIDKLSTPEGKEASIREKFGLAKEGEQQIVIIEDKQKKDETEDEGGGFFSFIKKLFSDQSRSSDTRSE